MASGIYKITDKRNNKSYIGRAVNLQNRKWRHFCYTHPEDYTETSLISEINMEIHKAMMESHDANDFIFEIIEECNINELNKREQYYIKKFNTLYPNGYNKTIGGNSYPHLMGEAHYNHKITQEEANLIKELLKERKSVEEIMIKIPNATMGIISSINNGRTWVDKNLKYPICRLSGLIKFTDEDVIEIRRRYEEGETTILLANAFNTSSSNISSICNGITHKDLPVLKTNISTRNIFTEKDVLFYREQYYIKNIPIKTLYENSIFVNKISYDGFKNMVNGTSYKEYKTYNKNIKINTLKDRNELIRKLANEGVSKKEIAKQIGCSERTVYRAINKENNFE